LFAAGCGRKLPTATTTSAGSAAGNDEVSPDALLDSAVQLLQGKSRNTQAHELAAQRLNQYVLRTKAAGKTVVEPLSDEVRKKLEANLPAVLIPHVESPQFDRPDAAHLDTCFLNRDIVAHVTADLREPLAKINAVFEWVVRNVQVLPPEELPPTPLMPGITLIVGVGSELERAWVFLELLRQVGVEGAMIAYTETDPQTKETSYRPWAPAALVDDALYIFDTTLGLPLPGPGGKDVATLRQVLDDPELLHGLDLDAEHPYRIQPAHLENLILLIESTPLYWAPRMKFLQEHLSGRNRLSLSSDLAALEGRLQSATAKPLPVALWSAPLRVYENRLGNPEFGKLIEGMLLHYLAHGQQLEARLAQLRGNYAEAIPVYMQNRVMQVPPPAQQNQQAMAIYGRIRQDSTYFLGLIKLEQGEYEPAMNWLGKSYLERYPTFPQGLWVSGARYNLGRCSERQNDTDKAIENYTTDVPGPQRTGNLIRARRLGWTGDTKSDPPPAPSEPSK
jgi:hypothetical protein